MRTIPKPKAGEYPPYASQYIDRLPDDGLLLAHLAENLRATTELFRSLPEEALLRSGVANGNLASVRALGYHIAGHEVHHIDIVRERYLRS